MAEVNKQAAGRPRHRRILAFDCSGASCGAALLQDGTVLAHRFAAMARGQAEALVPMIGTVVAESGLDFATLDALVTTAGPGSFTGIRLGLAAAHGLALAAAKPILAISSFEAHLAGLPADAGDGPIAVAIDSRRGPVFLQIFTPARRPLAPPVQIELADVQTHLPPGPVLAIGDGATALVDYVDASRTRLVLDRPHIDATALALLAGGFLSWRPDFLAPVPLYLRPPDVTTPKRAS